MLNIQQNTKNLNLNAQYTSENTASWYFTPANSCETCKVTTYSSQKMMLKAATIPIEPTHLPRRECQNAGWIIESYILWFGKVQDLEK
jgi:hypothetical protein